MINVIAKSKVWIRKYGMEEKKKDRFFNFASRIALNTNSFFFCFVLFKLST